MEIRDIKTSSGARYGIGRLEKGEYQYMDRDYRYNYIPADLAGCACIKTFGNDKMISENAECFSFVCDEDSEVYVLYADKHPVLPRWLEAYERTRLNVTRLDSSADNLKGYFSAYKRSFPKGKITLYGCSANYMLQQEWYMAAKGENYCMYSVCVKPRK